MTAPADRELLCYCFRFSRDDIAREIAATGKTTIPERIRSKAAAGLCSCAALNPSGHCCLREVGRFVQSLTPVSHGAE